MKTKVVVFKWNFDAKFAKMEKNPIFPDKSYFFFLNLNSTCSQLSFEVHNVSVAQNLKIRIFWGQKLAGNSKIQILSCMHVIYLKRKMRPEQKRNPLKDFLT